MRSRLRGCGAKSPRNFCSTRTSYLVLVVRNESDIEMAQKLKITLVRSGINRPQRQKDTVRRLGLTKLNASVIVPDNESVRGMVKSVSHLVKVESGD